MKMILQKAIAESGYCSRRKAEELIRNGKVEINGSPAFIGEQADPEKDKITIQGHLLPKPEKKIYLMLNKPLGYTCTNRRFPNEKNVFDLVNLPNRLFTIGRLDKNSRGLILLTNDGDLAQKLSHPKFGHYKEYEVKIKAENINPSLIVKKFSEGVGLGGGDACVKVIKIKYLQNKIFRITLGEGKKRQIRRMFAALGAKVVNLKRISFSGLTLDSLPERKWRYLNEEEIKKLKS